MQTHRFECKKCTLKFSFDSEHSDVNRFARSMNGIKCPKCLDVWGKPEAKIELDMGAVAGSSTKDSLAARGKANQEASREAMKKASEYRASVGEPEQVSIRRSDHMGAPSQYGRAVESVPKKVVENLESMFNQG